MSQKRKGRSRSERHHPGKKGTCSYCGKTHNRMSPSCGGHEVRTGSTS